MKLSLGFSPCPNDTFMFAALVHGWIDTDGLAFRVRMEDVETLNTLAEREELDITKLSFHKGLSLEDRYGLLSSGAALGHGCGPLIISRYPMAVDDLDHARVALPGIWTTAHLLFQLFFPGVRQKSFHLFSTIEDLVLSGQVDAGVIIHENRFTYEAKGLHKVVDLGETWETKTGYPIPLGGIFAAHRLNPSLRSAIEKLVRQSIQFAFAYPDRVMPYVRQYAQELQEDVIQSHIRLYVNDFSLDLGPEGHAAIRILKNFLA